MFGIGMPELIVILVIALIVIGPHKLPELAKSIGKGLAELKRHTDDLQHTLSEQARVLNEQERQKKAEEATASQSEASTSQAEATAGNTEPADDGDAKNEPPAETKSV